MREFEVEIDGAVFTVKQILPEDDTYEYTEKVAELIARACLLADDEAEKKANAPRKYDNQPSYDREHEKVTEVFREKVTEKYVEGQLEDIRKTYTEPIAPSVNYRRQIEELSRYLSRDSRRYDGYFEMY
ncbi:MAG: hypothetical protein IJ017_07140 [Oscillospiraceae bacterium]|nr:hypothetical protein [Oscillospiraceae bacterium]